MTDFSYQIKKRKKKKDIPTNLISFATLPATKISYAKWSSYCCFSINLSQVTFMWTPTRFVKYHWMNISGVDNDDILW